jgi:hypothetical protein
MIDLMEGRLDEGVCFERQGWGEKHYLAMATLPTPEQRIRRFTNVGALAPGDGVKS